MANRVPSQSRLREIGELAETIADEHCTSGPVVPESIIENKGITLSRGDYGDAFEGMLEHKGGRFHIYCNTGRLSLPTRIRFTLGHELGHYFIDDHRRALEAGLEPHSSFPSFNGQASDNPAEQEADHFSSNLLMPESRVRQLLEKAEHGLPAILRLQTSFDTSVTSSAVRYVGVSGADCTIIRWKPDGSFWKLFSDSTFGAGYRSIVSDSDQLPEDSPTRKALRGEAAEGKFHHCTTLASQWFPSVSQGSSRDSFLIEQAMALGEYGAITVLVPEGGSFTTASSVARW